MFNTKGKGDLTVVSILDRISEYDIFNYYVKDFVLGTTISSPLREDNNPSFCIFNSDKGILYKDFSTGEVGNCFNFVMRKFNCNFNETLNIISNDFALGLHSKRYAKYSRGYLGEITGVDLPKVRKRHTTIRIRSREYNSREDKDYWQPYGISVSVLREFNVHAIRNYWINSKLVYNYVSTDPAYAYRFGENSYKIMRPFSKYKWTTNCSPEHYQGYDQLPWLGDKLLITKAMKDVMVWYTFGINAIAPQGESNEIPYEFMEKLKKRFKRFYICFDNDEAGKRGSAKIVKKYPEIIPIFIPEDSGQKDIADFRKQYGEEKTRNLIKELLK